MTGILTRPQGEEQAVREERTVHGMAFWASTGPFGTTCRQCRFWGWSKGFKRDEEGRLEPRRCANYKRFSHGRNGDGVPAETASCKYFEARDKVPALISERKLKEASAEAAE